MLPHVLACSFEPAIGLLESDSYIPAGRALLVAKAICSFHISKSLEIAKKTSTHLWSIIWVYCWSNDGSVMGYDTNNTIQYPPLPTQKIMCSIDGSTLLQLALGLRQKWLLSLKLLGLQLFGVLEEAWSCFLAARTAFQALKPDVVQFSLPKQARKYQHHPFCMKMWVTILIKSHFAGLLLDASSQGWHHDTCQITLNHQNKVKILKFQSSSCLKSPVTGGCLTSFDHELLG